MDHDHDSPIVNHESSAIDSSSELYLHHSDHPNYILSTRLLSEGNYNHWKRSVEVSLLAKNKIGFVTGSCVRPTSPPNLVSLWDRCNGMVISWLLHSVGKDIAKSVLYCATAREIWIQLNSRYAQSNQARIYQIQRELASMTQGNLSVSSYFTKLKKLWDEYILLIDFSSCSCGSASSMHRLLQNQQIMQFLMGLNDSFNSVRGTILLHRPFPTLDEVFQMVTKEERQQEMLHPSSVAQDSAAFAANSNKSDTGNSGKGRGTSSSAPAGRGRGRNNFFCDHCKNSGHTIDRCYKLHPELIPKGDQSRPSYYCSHCKINGHSTERCYKLQSNPPQFMNDSSNRFAGSASASPSSPQARVFTDDQYEKLLSLLSQQSVTDNSSSHIATMAGHINENNTGAW